MTEKLLQFIWQFGYFNQNALCTTKGEKVQIISTGNVNKNCGPDFLNARIKINETVLAGSVELHIKTSDWNKHGHTGHEQYKNVILHVVYKHDKAIENGVSVLPLENRISKLLLDHYTQLMQGTHFIPCSSAIHGVNELIWLSWKERLLAERLTRKAQNIFAYLKANKDHWEESFWWLLARNFGMPVNADAFELLAKSISINTLAKHKSNIHQLEALLFGQAGLLQAEYKDDYVKLLKREYLFLQRKYHLQPIFMPLQFLRMRPQNFPTIRLAQLAMLVHSVTHLFSLIKETEAVETIRNCFDITANDYWHYRYRFDEPSAYKPKRLGSSMIDTILINTVIPVLFAYSKYTGQEHYKTKALRWLEKIKAETNAITTGFKNFSVHSESAYDTQALLELKNGYCNLKRCLECSVGNALLKRSV
ncbi:MAG: DUF2851 family protein [Flavisolibacter sp.]|nr:DUF2851 family protein [Flavisolibacter sp.]